MPTESASETESLARLFRFGPPTEKKYNLTRDTKDLTREIRRALDQNGLRRERPPKAYRDDHWLGFSQKKTPWLGVWQESPDEERAAIEKDEDLPKKLLDAYKICIDITPEKIPDLIKIIGRQFGGISFLGKVAKGDLLRRKNFPKVVLYLKGNLSEVLDLAINLALASQQQLGGSDSQLIKAKPIIEGSGVFLTQGEFTNKQYAEKLGQKGTCYYGPDRALFAETEKKFAVYFGRRKNQFLIEENLAEYIDLTPASERLLELQRAAFAGITLEDFKPGIRESDVTVGKTYLAPKHEVLTELLGLCDQRAEEIRQDPRFEKDYRFAIRAASVIYMFYILTHPLQDGNGQACTNLVSSLLFEGGHQRIYLQPFLDGHILRAKALELIVTDEMGTTECATHIPSLNPEQLAERRKIKQDEEVQEYAANIIKINTQNAWPFLRKYLTTGKLPNFGRINLPYSPRQALESFLTRADQIYRQLDKSLKDLPLGHKNLTLTEFQIAQQLGAEYFRQTP